MRAALRHPCLRLAYTLAFLAAAYAVIALVLLPNSTTFDEPEDLGPVAAWRPAVRPLEEAL